MAKNDFLVHLDMNGNEIQNVLAQNLSAVPTTNTGAGRFYFNTTDDTLYVKTANSGWLNALGQGQTYSEGSGIDITNNVISVDLATGANAGNVTLTTTNGLAANVAEASTSAKGIIEIATDTEASTGTSETLAVNPKQLATAVSGLIKLTNLSIASGSSNYLGYDNSTGQFSAKVDTTVGTVSTNLVTSGAVATAIENAIAGVIIPKGSISAISGLPTLVKAHLGWMYNFSASFTTTADFVEGAGVTYPSGTNVVVVEYTTGTYKYDVFSGFVDTSSFITASSTDTLTNKTIDADDNTISDLTTSNFKSGTIKTETDGVDFSTPTDTALLTEANIVDNFATKNALDAKAKFNSIDNPSLTASGGEATWTGTLTAARTFCQCCNIIVKEKSTGDVVYPSINIVQTNSGAFTYTIKFNTSSNIAANTYTAIITNTGGVS